MQPNPDHVTQQYLQQMLVVLLLVGVVLAGLITFFTILAPHRIASRSRSRRRFRSRERETAIERPEKPEPANSSIRGDWRWIAAGAVGLYILLVALMRPEFLRGFGIQPPGTAPPPPPRATLPMDDPKVRKRITDIIKTRRSGSAPPAGSAPAGGPGSAPGAFPGEGEPAPTVPSVPAPPR